jgi:hypothetical protein
MMTEVWHRLRSATPRSTTALGVDVALAAVFALLTVAERVFDTPLPAAQIPVALVL